MMSLTQRTTDQTIRHGPCGMMKTQTTMITTAAEHCSIQSISPKPKSPGMLEVQGIGRGHYVGIDAHERQATMMGMTRSHTLHSLSGSSTSSNESFLMREPTVQLDADFSTFGMELRRETDHSPEVPVFDKEVRRVMERHLRKARLLREKARSRTNLSVHASIASSVGVPYVRLRSERPFLYDLHTHPMHEILASTLGVEDLSKLHEVGDLNKLMEPLRCRAGRYKFHDAYDNFVTSFCIPLLHSMAMTMNMFHSISEQYSTVSYRYQAFPNIRVVRPGDTSDGPSCGTMRGQSVGYLHFHIPLTATSGTNALYTESHPGREDWHPLIAKSVGLGYLFDGARCLHFNMENTTDATSVALDFVIAIHGGNTREEEYADGECLCSKAILEDRFSLEGQDYYDEADINVGLRSPTLQIVAKKHGRILLDPDPRLGFPFN